MFVDVFVVVVFFCLLYLLHVQELLEILFDTESLPSSRAPIASAGNEICNTTNELSIV